MKNPFLINPKKAAWGLPLLAACVVAGCYPDPDFSTTPQIAYLSISKTTPTDDFGGKQDRIVVSIDYRDGDGDLGRADSQDTAQNYRLRLFLKRQGAFQEVIRKSIDPRTKKETRLDFQGVNFPLKGDGKPGPIEGTIDYTINFSHAFSIAPAPSEPVINTTPNNDTIYFRIQIVDRQLHVSNEVETEPIIINQR
ncbi:MAG: hypothetical protein H7Z75_21515 [Ferruginibacter sp.]|nr:hypothetical protein [Cytophagales bacterium]